MITPVQILKICDGNREQAVRMCLRVGIIHPKFAPEFDRMARFIARGIEKLWHSSTT